MRRHAAVALTISLILAAGTGVSCGSSNSAQPSASKPKDITAAALPGMLLSVPDINSAMGTDAMAIASEVTDLGDHSNFLPNPNCLGIWQVAEKRVYADSGFAAVRGQMLRQPNTDTWDSMVVQAVVNFPSADAANKFFSASGDRWSKCTNHTVNITVNDQKAASLKFGDLKRTDSGLTMIYTRANSDKSCQRALSVAANVIIDVAACNNAPKDQAATIASKIQSKTST